MCYSIKPDKCALITDHMMYNLADSYMMLLFLLVAIVQIIFSSLNQELMSAAKECQTAVTICCRITLSAKLQIWSKGQV